MGLRFAEAAGLEADEESIRQVIQQLTSEGLLLVAGDEPVGMLGLLVYQNYMRRSELLAQELFWWVEPEARATRAGIRLLEAGEALVRERGAKRLLMLCLDAMDDRVAKLYERRGYTPQERTYMKVL